MAWGDASADPAQGTGFVTARERGLESVCESRARAMETVSMRRDEGYARGRTVAPLIVAATIGLLGIGFTLALLLVQQRRSDRAAEMQTREVANSLALSLERYLNLLAARSEALAGLVEIQPDIAGADLERFASRLIGGDPAFRNLALAPQDIVSFVHPVAGNTGVIGVDLSKRSGQSALVQRVRRERRTMLAGPINLVQGGVGLASRSPVLLPAVDGGKESRYWGMAVLVIDYQAMLDRSGVSQVQHGYDVAIRGRDGGGADGEIFHGRRELFDAPRVAVTVNVPGGSWVLVAQPKAGWNSVHLLAAPLLPLLGVVVSLLFALLGYRIASDRVAIRELAMSDPLTRLPNRRHVQWQLRDSLDQLNERVRCGAIVLIDFDDFKPVNDLLGHRIGDEVLRVIAARMRAAIRPGDFLARIGGDEFLMLHTNSEPQCRAEVEATATRLLAAIAQAVVVEDHAIGVRASVGIALFPEHGRDPTILRECADRALYRAKHDGGNRAIIYRPGDHDIDRVSGNHRSLPT